MEQYAIHKTIYGFRRSHIPYVLHWFSVTPVVIYMNKLFNGCTIEESSSRKLFLKPLVILSTSRKLANATPLGRPTTMLCSLKSVSIFILRISNVYLIFISSLACACLRNFNKDDISFMIGDNALGKYSVLRK